MKKKITSLLLLLVMLLSLVALTACGGDGDDGGDDPQPVVCQHETLSGWKKDSTNHWKECTNTACKEKVQKAAHDFGEGTVCSVCQYEKTEGGDVPVVDVYPWFSETIKFQLTENSNGGELSSECKRYIAGDSGDLDTIDTMVLERNALAKNITNIEEIEWDYLKDISAYGWGKNIDIIYEAVSSPNKNTPDIFCNFVYDMVCVSLKGSFMNLNATDKGTYDKNNYFEFAISNNPDFKDTGEGYMYEYMRSLTLSRQKMYCISSDYFTDMVRAFYVIPVNATLMNGLGLDTTGENPHRSDRTGDGDFNMDDFFELIWDMDWTYDTMAKFSVDVSSDEVQEAGSTSYDLRDTVGFALGQSGLCASGMLYTTSITVIAREFDPETNDYVYWYPDTNQDLIDFCANLKTLFSTDGVICVGGEDTYGFKTQGGEGGSNDAIRARFAANKVLFGDVMCVGALEYEAYQNMEGGFGVAPVPLYRSGSNDQYLTAIHNLGRIGAIASCSNKFPQCSAYLNYQSLNSTDILNEYYEVQLKGKVAQGANSIGNAKMLDYIRENVRSSFDKVFEDAIAKYFLSVDPDAMQKKWHEMIKNARYKLDTMGKEYGDLYLKKQGQLELLKEEYETYN